MKYFLNFVPSSVSSLKDFCNMGRKQLNSVFTWRTLIFHLLKSVESLTGSVISSRITAFTLHIYGCFQSFLLQVPTTKDPSKEGSSLLTSSLGVCNGESGEEGRGKKTTQDSWEESGCSVNGRGKLRSRVMERWIWNCYETIPSKQREILDKI